MRLGGPRVRDAEASCATSTEQRMTRSDPKEREAKIVREALTIGGVISTAHIRKEGTLPCGSFKIEVSGEERRGQGKGG